MPMPTSTSVGGFEFFNAGPLSTTWTAPSSCSTMPVETIVSGHGHPYISGLFDATPLSSCDPVNSTQNCVPNGDEIDAIYEVDNVLDLMTRRHLYSPGLFCPNDYETAGVVAMINGSARVFGVFTSDGFQYDQDGPTAFPRSNFALNALTSALAPTETAVACCPSGFSANPFYECYSHFPATELAGQTGCVVGWSNIRDQTVTRTFDYFGETTTYVGYDLVPPTSGTVEITTYTFTVDESGMRSWGPGQYYPTGLAVQGMAHAPFIYLVNGGEQGESDGDGGEGVSESSTGTGSGAEETAGQGNGESAAGVLTANSWAAVGAMAAVWAIGVAAGGGLLAAW